MKLQRREFVSVGVLLIIISILIISVFAVPAINNLYENFEISKYESTKADIINGAKSKFSASINEIGKNEVVEYTIQELIDEGYLKGNEINPLTGKEYNKDDKVLVISKNGNITYKFINGTTLIKEVKQSSSVKMIDNQYYYVGSNPSNYMSFNEEIYRIVKIDEKNNVYITKEDVNKKIKKEDIDSYLNSYKNDNFSSDEAVLETLLIDSSTYFNTKNGKNESYLDNDNYFWITDSNEVKVYDSLNSIYLSDIENAWINPIIKLESSLVIEKGNGSRINPYVVN